MKLVTIAIFDLAHDAHLLAAKLDANGIPSVIADELTNTINPLYTQATGGIKVQIHEADIQRAQEVLGEIKAHGYLDSEGGQVQCPKCHSKKLSKAVRGTKSLKSWLGFFVGALVASHPLHTDALVICDDCGHRFDLENEADNSDNT